MNKKNKPITKLSGNQGVKKTSTMQALIYALAGIVPDVKEFERLINDADNTINLNQEFLVENDRYRVRATKSKFELQRFLPGSGKGGGKWYPEDEPKTTLRQLIGPLGLDPKKLAELEGVKQIDTFRKTYTGTNSEDLEKKEHALRQALSKAVETRRDANREYTRIKRALEINTYWTEREKWDSQFKGKNISKAEAEKAFNEAQENVNTYNKYQSALPTYDGRMETEDAEIARLEEQLRLAKERKQKLVEGKVACQKWLEDNAGMVNVYNAAKEAYMNVSEMLVKQNDYKLMIIQEEEMNEYESIIQSADNTKDDLNEQLRELTKKYLPNIPDLEIKIASGFESDEPEGIYYKGRNIGTLSESELWQLFFLIWQEMEVQFVFVENITSLGSDAIEILNNIAASGAKVFASQMDRKQDSIKITFIDEIK